MSQETQDKKISYLELTTRDIAGAKKFYSTVFGWSFEDWGPDYIGFRAAEAGLDGGFAKGEPKSGEGAPLVVLYAAKLEAAEQAVVAAGGTIVTPIFSFPGGRRFHFADGVGNVLAVWSE